MTLGEAHHLSELVSVSLKGARLGVGLALSSTLSHPRIVFSRKTFPGGDICKMAKS